MVDWAEMDLSRRCIHTAHTGFMVWALLASKCVDMASFAIMAWIAKGWPGWC